MLFKLNLLKSNLLNKIIFKSNKDEISGIIKPILNISKIVATEVSNRNLGIFALNFLSNNL